MSKKFKYNGMTVAELVKERGLPQLAGRLGMSQQAVSYWLSFQTSPSVLTAAKIIRLSNGRCTFDSIYAPFANAHGEPEQLELFKD